MSTNLEYFQSLFFEESFEGLELLEAGLLELASGGGRETIDDIFRAAHSIKGGSGTFGFSDITSLTHYLETLLDELRTGRRKVEKSLTQVLLEGVDGLRYLLETRRAGDLPDVGRISGTIAKLEAILGSSATAPVATVESASLAQVWNIQFTPHRHLLRTGNEPLRILSELSTLGHLTVITDTSTVPPLDQIDAEDIHLSWTLTLETVRPKEDILEIFAWVADDCDLMLTPVERKVECADNSVAADAERPAEASSKRPAPETATIRVGTDKVDAVINLVGELVITQSMLSCLGDQFEMRMIDRLRDGLGQLARHTRELQETVLKMRMLPISSCFQRFPRLVHDVGEKLGKKVNLRLAGEQTEIDKTVLERISDPLVHLVRNSLDHGIESPERRREAGKAEVGTLSLEASHEGGTIVIVVSDDGAGLDSERILAKAIERGLVGANETLSEDRIFQLIFLPGFSTAATVTELSGRGVGMDVVRRNLEELGGSIEIQSRKGVGTRFRIRLPLTLSILDGQLVQVGTETFVIPLISIVESIQTRPQHIHQLATGDELYRFREDYIPLIRLDAILGDPTRARSGRDGLLVVVETNQRRAGLLVDDLLGQQQVVIKSLEENFRKVDGLSGATILGDGEVAMILDVEGIVRLAASRASCAVLRPPSISTPQSPAPEELVGKELCESRVV